MSCLVCSLSSVRFGRVKLSLIVLAVAALVMPLRAHASCTTVGSVTTCTGSSLTVNGGLYASQGSTNVVSVPGTVAAISITLSNVNITGTNPGGLNSVAMALVPPTGKALDVVSGVCNSSNTTFTLADTGDTGLDAFFSMMPPIGGGATCPGAFSGTYYASDWFPDLDTFNSPGPGTNYNSGGNNGCSSYSTGCGTYGFATAFGLPASATSMNGTWTLYVANQATPLGSGSIGSWSISFTTVTATATTTSLTPSPNGSSSLVYTNTDVHGDSLAATPVTLTATVNPNPGSGTVTFYDSTGTNAGQGTQLGTASVNGSGQATLNATFSAEGNRSISAVFNGTSSYVSSTSSKANVLTTNHPYNPSGTTFCNGPITINDDTGGTPYPSLLALGTGFSQLQGTIENVTVSLNNFSLSNNEELDDLGVMLQAPGSITSGIGSNGNAFQFLSWAGNPFTSGNLMFSDQGSAEIPPFNPPSCSNCLPTDNWVDILSSNPDTFPLPAPSIFGTAAPTGTATFANEFGGLGANNTWSLYVDNRLIQSGTLGQIGEWCLNFTMQTNAHPTTLTLSPSPNPATIISGSTANVNLTATVTSDQTVNAGTVTFVDGTTTLGTASVVNGTASLNNVALAERTHQIQATYGGTNTGTEFGISSGKIDVRVNKQTTNPASGSGAGPYSYCNTGAISAPGLTYDAGAASPYPSNIFVTNLPGTVKATSISLNGFNTKDQGDLMSLLVGPGGNSLDFFSLTGTNVSVPPTINLTFQDGGANIGSTNLAASGTYAPESLNNLTYPQCPPNASDCGTENVGPPLGSSSTFTPPHKAAPEGVSIFGNAAAAGVFGGTTASTYNGNGTWSLYLDDGGPLGGGEATNVANWCVNLTVNQPVAAATTAHTGNGIGGNFVQGEQGAQITVAVANNGPGSTGDPTGNSPMTVTDVLNSNLTYAGTWSGTGWSCSGTTTVSCSNDSSIASGSSYPTLTINVNVAAAAPSSVTNQVSVSGAGAALVSSNSDSITVDPAPVLAVSVGHTGTFTQGSTAEWDVTVSNTASGGRTLGTMTLTDTLPSGYTLSGSSATGGTWGCGGASNVITCTSTSQINGGSNSKIALTVNVPANSPITVSDSASAYGGGDLVHTSSGTAATSNSDSVTVIQVPASVAINGSSTQSATILTAFASPLTVTVEDAGGVAIASYGSVSFAAATGTNGQTGLFSNSSNLISATTNGSGQISESITAGSKVGSYSVTVTAGTAQNSFTLTNAVGAPASIAVVSGNGQSTADTTAFPAPLVVQILDAGSNPVPGVSVTFTAPASGASLTFANSMTTTTVPTDASGDATSSAMVANSAIGNYNVTATAGGLTTQFSETNALGPYSQLAITAPGSAYTGVPIQFTVNAEDAGGNVVPTATPTVTFTSSDGSATLPPGTALASGTGTFSATLTQLGPQTITAADAADSISSVPSNITVNAIPSFVVTNTADSGAGSLRDAIAQANAAGAGNITFDSALTGGTITLGSTLNIPAYTAVTGPTPSSVTVAGGGSSSNFSVFTVANGVARAAIANLIITGGNISLNGGGISNGGALTISGTTISGNSANSNGGGIFNSGTLTINNSTISNNTSVFNGGAILSYGTLTITNSTISGNSTQGSGGGIITYGALTVEDSTVANNSAGTSGGGIVNNGTSTLTLIDSTISGNSAQNSAGGILNGASLAVSNSIVAGNSAGAGTYPDIDNGGTYNPGPGNLVNTSAGSTLAPGLSPLGNYGGATQTMLPLPGSAAICNGSAQAIPSGVITDQRGFPNTTTYGSTLCVDSGAVQTNYALAFSQQPSTSGSTATVGVARAISPAPAISVTESGNAFSGAAVTMSASAGTLNGTTTQTTGGGGTATFSGLSIGQIETNDTLTASLALNPAIPLSLTTTSYPFNVSTIPPTLTSPSGSGLLSGATPFTWDPGAGVTDFHLRIGIVGPGSADIYDSGNLLGGVTSETVTIPANGAQLFVRLSYEIAGVWAWNDYTFTEAGSPTAPTLTSPSGPGTISGSTQFTWTDGGSRYFHLKIGIDHPGSADIYDSLNLAGTVTSETVTIPANGVTVYVRLSYYVNGTWAWNDYTFTEAGTPTPPSLTAPTGPGSLSGSTLFTWDPGAGPTEFRLKVGSSLYANDIYDSGNVAATVTSETVNITVSTVFVQLGYKVNGVWYRKEYTFGVTPPTLTAPSGTGTLSGSTQFTWDPGAGWNLFRCKVGTTGVGSADLADTGNVATSVTSVTANVPANGGTVYVRLAYIANGVSAYTDYTFTEAP